MKEEHLTRKRIYSVIRLCLIAALVILVIILSVKYLVPMSKLLVTEEGRLLISERIDSYGMFAPLLFSGLMALQIVIAFIPGGPLELVAGMLFGGIIGTIFTMLGAIAGTAIVYFLVKLFGRPLVHFFVSEERMEKFSILQDERRLEFWVFILFLIPGIPKDLLTYIVPLTKMRPLHFIVLANIARFPAIIASVFMGDSISDGRYWLCIVIACIAALAAFIGFRLKTSILKEKGETP